MSTRFAGRRKLLGGLPAVLLAPFAGLFVVKAKAGPSPVLNLQAKVIGEAAATLKPVEWQPEQIAAYAKTPVIGYEYQVVCSCHGRSIYPCTDPVARAEA
jgi:hypothetical protein